jgi:hypothetical protein
MLKVVIVYYFLINEICLAFYPASHSIKKIFSGFDKATRKAKYQSCSYILMVNNPEGDGNERKNNCISFLAWNVVLGISSYRNVS